MLQIRLRKPSNEDGGGAKPSPADIVRVACPDHLVLADLPVAKSLGSANSTSVVRLVGRRSGRLLGERVHFCVRCDFPIAIYGQLSPCEHVFCLDCARTDSLCYLCDERIQKIQTIKFSEGIFICAAPHCLKSFLKKTDFESHIHETHADLLHSNTGRNGNDSEAVSARKRTTSDSTVQAPPRPLISLSSNPQVNDHQPQPRDQQPPRPIMQSMAPPPFIGQIQSNPLEQQGDSNPHPGFDRFGPQHRFLQQTIDSQSGLQQPGQMPDRQQRIISESPFTEYPMYPQQPPNIAVQDDPNPGLFPVQFSCPPFAPDGDQPVYAAPYEMPRPDSVSEVRSEQGSLLGFPPGPRGGIHFAESYPQPWNRWPAASSAGQGTAHGVMNASDSQGRADAFLREDYNHRNQGVVRGQGGITMGPRDGKGILSPPPPLPPPHLSQLNRNNYYGESSRD